MFIVVGLILAQAAAKPGSGALIGAWRGESRCLVRPSGCRDEDALYRIAAGAKPDQVILSGNKIAGGQEINMGSGPCSYKAKAQSVDCRLPNGNSIHLELKGASLEGNMTLSDGTLWRKITLHKQEHE